MKVCIYLHLINHDPDQDIKHFQKTRGSVMLFPDNSPLPALATITLMPLIIE